MQKNRPAKQKQESSPPDEHKTVPNGYDPQTKPTDMGCDSIRETVAVTAFIHHHYSGSWHSFDPTGQLLLYVILILQTMHANDRYMRCAHT